MGVILRQLLAVDRKSVEQKLDRFLKFTQLQQ